MIKKVSKMPLAGTSWHSVLADTLLSLGEKEGCCVLNSGANCIAKQARRFIPLEPVLKIFADHNGSYVCSKSSKIKEFSEVWGALEWLSESLEDAAPTVKLPLAAGYLSYELNHYLEDVPLAGERVCSVPLYLFYVYQSVIEENEGDLILHSVTYEDALEPFWTWSPKKSGEIKSTISYADPYGMEEELALHSNHSSSEYSAKVEAIIDGIARGDVYQVNFTQRFTLTCEITAPEFFLALEQCGGGKFGGYLHADEIPTGKFSIASASPELFLYADEGILLTSPIKGSRPRGATGAEDLKLKSELQQSEKDLAELAMIVDLARNDLGRTAKPGSVQVIRYPRLETLSYAHHLVADVSAVKRDDANLVSVIKAMFPCGSITGAPKIAAMNFISRLEDSQRGVYTGSMGYFGSRGHCCFNVAIRTALLRDNRLIFQTGGGVVYDSSGSQEYEESIFKAKSIYVAWKQASLSSPDIS